MLAKQTLLRVDEDRTAVKCTDYALDDTDDEEDIVLLRDGGYFVGGGRRNLDGLVVVCLEIEETFLRRCSGSHDGAEVVLANI